MRVSKDWYKEQWVDIFQIDLLSPSGLSWRVSRGTNVKAGAPCGYMSDLNYWKVEYKGKSVYVHRIVYFLSHGYIDRTKVVDHIDGNPSNNCISNLRMISYEENTRNRKISKTNRSGVSGVHLIHEWVATWSEDNKARSKAFPVSIFGSSAQSLAEQYRLEQLERLNLLNHNYSSRHINYSKREVI